MPDDHLKEALRRIHECADTRRDWLDLGDLKLEVLPMEIGTLAGQLRVLALGIKPVDPATGKLGEDWQFDRRPAWQGGLEQLAEFWILESLDLSGCEGLTNLEVLRNLPNLQSVDLYGCDGLTDFEGLRDLPNLQSVDLYGCSGLTNVEPLRDLTNLQNLDLNWCKGLTSLEGLRDLQNLNTLGLGGCSVLTNLEGWRSLPNMRTLILWSCSGLTNLDGLRDLPNLQTLDLSDCSGLTNLDALGNLPCLQTLDLSGCERLTNLDGLRDLPNLQSLDLSGCYRCRDLLPLGSLRSLKSLEAVGIEASQFPRHILDQLSFLSISSIAQDYPRELFSTRWDDDCLPRIHAYRADVERGQVDDQETKVFLLGNGAVGKTQFCRFLRGLPFDPEVPSTHGLEIHEVRMDFPGLGTRSLNLWDFGGQDIYHGTHSLFLKSRAVFIVLWNPQSEEVGEFERGGIGFRNYRLPYWIEYLKTEAHKDAAVLIIQSQCETRSEECTKLPADLDQLDRWHRKLSFGSRCRRAAGELTAALAATIEKLTEAYGTPKIPQKWAAVRDHLRRLRDGRVKGKKRLPLISREQFNEICSRLGPISSTDALLHYLHHSGVVFRDEDHLGDRIILDQNWALLPIYALFHREECFKQIRDRACGRFTRQQIHDLHWKQKGHSATEEDLFISLMESCSICFYHRTLHNGEKEYVAIDLLPPFEHVKDEVARLWPRNAEKVSSMRWKMDFLHQGMIRSVLTRIGRSGASRPLYWRYGCLFDEEETRSCVKLEAVQNADGSGEWRVEAVSEQPAKLKAKLESLFRNCGLLDRMKPEGHEAFEWNTMERSEAKELAVGGLAATRPEVFISYAWGDDSEEGKRRKEAVERVEAYLKTRGYEVRRDVHDIRYGSSISAYIERIGAASRIVVVVSDKYLRSPFCMNELYRIYQRCGTHGREFQERVLPVVLEGTRIAKPLDRGRYAKYWDEEKAAIDKEFGDKKFEYLGALGGQEYRLMQDYVNHVPDMLHHLNDVLSPRYVDELSFEKLKEYLDTVLPEVGNNMR